MGGISGGEEKSCRGETLSEQSATLPLKPIKPHKAKRQKPETHPAPDSVDEAEWDAALTGCDFGQKKEQVAGGLQWVWGLWQWVNNDSPRASPTTTAGEAGSCTDRVSPKKLFPCLKITPTRCRGGGPVTSLSVCVCACVCMHVCVRVGEELKRCINIPTYKQFLRPNVKNESFHRMQG